jgi:hypothetical protein
MSEESGWVGLRLEPLQALGKKCELARLKRNGLEPMNSFGLEAYSLVFFMGRRLGFNCLHL